MCLIRRPLVRRALAEHIVARTQGDIRAAMRRLDVVDALIADIMANPLSGMRLDGPLEGWLVRHGGRAHRITIVFKPDLESSPLYIALVAFGGQGWITQGLDRKTFED